jgi:hypothetical protein
LIGEESAVASGLFGWDPSDKPTAHHGDGSSPTASVLCLHAAGWCTVPTLLRMIAWQPEYIHSESIAIKKNIVLWPLRAAG